MTPLNWLPLSGVSTKKEKEFALPFSFHFYSSLISFEMQIKNSKLQKFFYPEKPYGETWWHFTTISYGNGFWIWWDQTWSETILADWFLKHYTEELQHCYRKESFCLSLCAWKENERQQIWRKVLWSTSPWVTSMLKTCHKEWAKTPCLSLTQNKHWNSL